jgi:hypothetical protein
MEVVRKQSLWFPASLNSISIARQSQQSESHSENKLPEPQVRAMQTSKWDFDPATHDDESHVPRSESPEDFADQMGIRIALVALCVASFIAAVWFLGGPSFEKCSAIANVADRNACYDALRKELLKPPAKGADIPKG